VTISEWLGFQVRVAAEDWEKDGEPDVGGGKVPDLVGVQGPSGLIRLAWGVSFKPVDSLVYWVDMVMEVVLLLGGS